MQILLITGPGGAGTSTCAAAAAVRAARAGRRTVLLTRQRPPVTGLDGEPGLESVVVDPRAALERFWAGSVDRVSAVLPQLAPPPASSVVPVPGVAELALLAELARIEADLVVLDAGPVEAATGLVELPSTLRWWLARLVPPRVRTLAAVGRSAGVLGGAPGALGAAAVSALPALEGLLASSPLADPSRITAWFAALPRPGTAAELRTAATALALHGVRATAVLARVLPKLDGSPWAVLRGAEQEAALAELEEVAPVRRVPEAASAPADVDGVVALLPDGGPFAGNVRDGGAAPDSGTPYAAPERMAGGWRLSVPLPFAERSDVGLARWADDLVVHAGGRRRSLRLDPLLRRCTVTGGRLDRAGTADAVLEVTFVPDPQQWPADLLAAQERTG
ncbi:ion transporter [Geodermatophilus sp. YIM 151500]|uniref:ArsA family ATPase n=1 Tax=Geodermatophilus sp. YIM 151500 TaxID=2984531 RepID=UPI0021E4F79B|nr:ArsA-related P-loop ATPase [Geodermatophilus sp. YIM 151500]MCV2491338.1 ion transporter [Geodermatophilus sp. YIM 151500]